MTMLFFILLKTHYISIYYSFQVCENPVSFDQISSNQAILNGGNCDALQAEANSLAGQAESIETIEILSDDCDEVENYAEVSHAEELDENVSKTLL